MTYQTPEDDRNPLTCRGSTYKGITAVIGPFFLEGNSLLLQQTLNNPMARPSLLGINASATLSVLLGILLYPSLAQLLPLFSSIGALAGSMVVFSLAAMYRFSRLTLILSGIALSTVLEAISDALLTVFPDLAHSRYPYQ